MTITEIRQMLESPYDRKVWKSFLQTQFTNNKLNAEDRTIALPENTLSKQCLSLGNYEINQYAKIGIFEVELNEKVNLSRNRVALRNLLKSLTRQISGAMVVFVQGDKWRFSYISKRKVKNKETSEIEDKETAPKRYTYLFGKGEKALTAAQRFDKLIQKQKGNLYEYLTVDDFEEAFSVEKLSKEFFANYKTAYEDFVQFLTGKRYTKRGNKYVEQVMGEPNWQLTALFGKDEKQARDFVKRMMGRIVFLYFIQKKGWLAVKQGKKWGEGNPDYLYDLFKNSKQKDDLYARELVPLFFNRLNNEDSENKARDERFPYLNGGLFDDTQDKRYNKLYLPEDVFAKMFDTFNNYNFTIYENAPDEHTVAVDPEMLGHIFENLLEDNKDKGAFYTPKEIVHYMCKESLKAYLYAHEELYIADNELAKETIDKIIQQQELNEDEKHIAEKNAYKIIDVLENVKICDPAIGSGAFPMGLLQEIFNAQIYLQELKGFKKGVSDADIKKHIIEESIYGVDIDAGAVDIARLRFWLSLVVDEEVPKALPNLDYKIMKGDSLLGIPYNTVINVEADQKFEHYKQLYFEENDPDKKMVLKEKINYYIEKILETANHYSSYKIDFDFRLFFSEVFHGSNSGFDIVIGNPPYVQLQKNSGNLSKQYEKVGYKTFERTGDIYSLFYERGFELLKPKGHLCFITSNKWMRAGYGESTRKFFAENANPILLIDFAGQKIFEAATVDVNILMFSKEKNQQKTLACIVKEKALNNLSVFVRQQSTECNFSTKESWTILSPIEQSIKKKIEAVGTPLKDWDINIYRGILTGYNEAFIIDGTTKDKLIKEDAKSAEIIRPILRGRDIKRYGYDFADLWLINTHNGIKEKGIKPVDIKDYPAIKKHLDVLYPELEKRQDKGETPYNLRNCAYMDDFSKQKIIYIEIMTDNPEDGYNFPCFSFDTENCVALNTAYIMTGNVEELKYILGILNSKLGRLLVKNYVVQLQQRQFRMLNQYVVNFPIPKIDKSSKIATLVDEVLSLEKQTKDTKSLEQKIDNTVYKLFDFNDQEVEFIQSL